MKWLSFVLAFTLVGCSVNTPSKSTAPKVTNIQNQSADKTEKLDSVEFKKENKTTENFISVKQNEQTMKETKVKKQEKIIVDAPIIEQMPELYNGCEIASVTMLLQHAGLKVNKFEVAKNTPRDDDPLVQTRSGDVLHWGNPNHGFVGSITGKSQKGYGIYNKPLQELIEKYLPKRSVNLTGKSFEEIEQQIQRGKPVVALSTTSFTPAKKWDTWKHKNERIKGTNELHAVLIVGFDSNSVYVNDPYTGEKARKINKNSFIQSWDSLGKQALSYR
ncbi:MAG TPA: C39 family peptidase [Bacillota bacterium]|nr:C39 family peptidase [Bacillota bacterium]